MNRWVYRLMYLFTRPGWDSGITPPEVVEAFEGGDIPPGTALDLGCGTGTNAIFIARSGRDVIGLDFAPEAIKRAQRKARQAGVQNRTTFRVADVTRLAELGLPAISFALDMGCFHGLSEDGQRRYAQALAAQMPAGGRYMLYAIDPQSEGGVRFGTPVDRVREVFRPAFDIQREQRGSFRDRGSTWFWMERRA